MSDARVFVNGCFDILHVGHVRLLDLAATFGRVVVALNSDESVRAIKGSGRPVNCLAHRVEILRALKSVQFVISFNELHPTELLSKLYKRGTGPDIVVKGSAYADQHFPEKSVILDNGGSIVYYDLIEGVSTTDIVERIRDPRNR